MNPQVERGRAQVLAPASALRVTRVAGAIALVAGGVWLVLWSTGVARSLSLAGSITVKTNTSLGLCAAGCAFLLWRPAPVGRRRWGTATLAGLVLLLGLLTVSEYVFRGDFGIDQLLFQEPPGSRATMSPNRMGPPAAISFTLIGAGLLALHARRRRAAVASGAAVCALNLVPAIGFLYGATKFYSLSGVTGIGWSTVLAFLGLGGGLIALAVHEGSLGLLLRNDAGGSLLRRTLPVVVLASVILGLAVSVAEQHGILDGQHSTGTMVVCTVLLLTLLLWRSAARLSVAAEDRERDSLALRESERRFHLAIDGSPILIFSQDAHLRYTWAHNPARPGEDIIGKTDHDLLPKEDADRLTEIKRSVLVSGVRRRDEIVTQARGGGEGQAVAFDLTTEPLRDPEGNVVGIVCVATDITDRKKAEQERERLLGELREGQALLESDLDAMTRLQKLGALFLHEGNLDAVLGEIVEAAMAIASCDAGSIQILDRTTSKLRLIAHRGMPDWWAEYWREVAGEDGACGTAMRRLDRVIVEDVERHPIFAGTPALDVQLRAGVRSVQSIPLISRSGSLLGVFSTHWKRTWSPDERTQRLLDLLARQAADSMERAHAEEALRSANALLVEADRRKDAFLAMLSHELRNPLAPITSCLYVLEQAAPGGTEARNAQEIIERQVRQLTRLVDDLLDVTRIASNKIRIQRDRLDLNGLVGWTVEDHRSLLQAAGVSVRLERAPGPVPIYGDPSRLGQALGNLLNNAAKFTPRGGRVEVTVSSAPNAGMALVRVADSGVGMSPELLATIFHPFVQADASLDRSRGGLGLGLALVKGIVELHGGDVSAYSDGPGRGTEFVIRLPLDPSVQAIEPFGPEKRDRRDAGAPRRMMGVRITGEREQDAAQP